MPHTLSDNIATFSHPESLEEYSHDYLRTSEEYLIRRYMHPGMRVLDLGCGTGRTTIHVKNRGCDVVGVDLSDAMIRRARERHPGIDFRVGDALALDFPDASFNAVFFSFNGIDNLFPFSERVTVLREMLRVLRPEGILAYSSHNAHCIPHTRHGATTFLRNLFRVRPWPHVRIERHPFGQLRQWFTTIARERATLRSLRCTDIEIRTNGTSQSRLYAELWERFPLFIARAPAV